MISGWSSSSFAPRRSHDQPRVQPTKISRSPSPAVSDTASEPRRRSSSDATPRQTPATTRFLSSNTISDQEANKNVLSSNGEIFTSKRLGFFADKLSSSLSGSANQKGQTQLSHNSHPQTHTRAADSTSQSSTIPLSSSMASSATLVSMNKSHSSPSKASHGRTYDSKLVSREMHRLGNLAHLPSALTPTLSAPSVSTLALPTSGGHGMAQMSNSSPSTADPWRVLHVHVLPLFNGEPLRIPIEDLNVLVTRHIRTVVSAAPSKALATLEHDASELIASGMVTLNAKLTGIDDEKLVGRVVEIWRFFWDQVLTYIEGVLLPLQTDPLLSSLYRTPKSHRTTSPTRHNPKGVIAPPTSSQVASYPIDVRSVALIAFRDRVILPLFPRLYTRLSSSTRDTLQDTMSNQQPRLQQMLLVLSSQSQHPLIFSLTAPTPQPTSGEMAITDLLRVVRTGLPNQNARTFRLKGPAGPHSHAPSFLSAGMPRDRRGRIAHKTPTKKSLGLLGIPGVGDEEEEEGYGDETPRNGITNLADMERKQERDFLEALKSPDIESSARASVGGWGLGGGHVDVVKTTEEEEEDYTSDWDAAQAAAERSVGMNPPSEPRRRMT